MKVHVKYIYIYICFDFLKKCLNFVCVATESSVLSDSTSMDRLNSGQVHV